MIRKIANKMRKIHHFIKNLVMPFLHHLVSTGPHCTTVVFFVTNCFPKMHTNHVDVKKSYGEKCWGFFKTEKISFLRQCCRVTPVLPEIRFFCCRLCSYNLKNLNDMKNYNWIEENLNFSWKIWWCNVCTISIEWRPLYLC